MKFVASAILFAATAMALPHEVGTSEVKFPMRNEYTLAQAQSKCGNDAKVSCCNKSTYTRDFNTVNQGPLAGVLQTALGGGPGGDGLGLFDQCSDLGLNIPILGGGLNSLVNQNCEQNIACCQNSDSEANGNLIGIAVPCVALGSLI